MYEPVIERLNLPRGEGLNDRLVAELDTEDALALLALGVLNPSPDVDLDEVDDEDVGATDSMSKRRLTYYNNQANQSWMFSKNQMSIFTSFLDKWCCLSAAAPWGKVGVTLLCSTEYTWPHILNEDEWGTHCGVDSTAFSSTFPRFVRLPKLPIQNVTFLVVNESRQNEEKTHLAPAAVRWARWNHSDRDCKESARRFQSLSVICEEFFVAFWSHSHCLI